MTDVTTEQRRELRRALFEMAASDHPKAVQMTIQLAKYLLSVSNDRRGLHHR